MRRVLKVTSPRGRSHRRSCHWDRLPRAWRRARRPSRPLMHAALRGLGVRSVALVPGHTELILIGVPLSSTASHPVSALRRVFDAG